MIIKNDIGLSPTTGQRLEKKLHEEVFPISRMMRNEINRTNSTPITVTGNITLLPNHYAILADSSAAAVNITLPNYADSLGTIFWIKNVDDTNGVTVIGTVDGAVNRVIGLWESVVIKAYTDGWYIYSDYTLPPVIPPASIEPDVHYSRHTGIVDYIAYYTIPRTMADFVNLVITADRLYAHPFVVPKTITVDEIVLEVVAGSAGNARLGIWEDNNCYPGDLLLDAGAVDTTVAATKTIAINQTLTPGLKWAGFVSSATPNVRAMGTAAMDIMGGSPGSTTNNRVGVRAAYAYGALPDPYPAGATAVIANNKIPILFLHLSA